MILTINKKILLEDIEFATIKDLPKIQNIFKKRFNTDIPNKKYIKAINNKTVLVSKNKNNIDGFTRFNIYSKTKSSKELNNYLKEIPSLKNKNILFIKDTAVNKSNKGIGGNLRKEIENIAKKEKANIVTIPWNDKVEKWNIKNDFKIIHSNNKNLPSSVAYREIK